MYKYSDIINNLGMHQLPGKYPQDTFSGEYSYTSYRRGYRVNTSVGT